MQKHSRRNGCAAAGGLAIGAIAGISAGKEATGPQQDKKEGGRDDKAGNRDGREPRYRQGNRAASG
ncbi:MAG: hypothetical protein Kow0032_16600 [Methyloligellaceae bacterium]